MKRLARPWLSGDALCHSSTTHHLCEAVGLACNQHLIWAGLAKKSMGVIITVLFLEVQNDAGKVSLAQPKGLFWYHLFHKIAF